MNEAIVQKPTVPTGGARYFNRELSWLTFNERVLEEAGNKNHPLLERLRFLSISGSNLDEFYMVRVAGLMGQVSDGVQTPSADGMTPAEQLAEINIRANELIRHQQAAWATLMAELREASIFVVEPQQLTDEEKSWIEQYFLENIFPVLTPLAIDPAHPFPFMPNLGIAMVLELERPKSTEPMRALMRVPAQLRRRFGIIDADTEIRMRRAEAEIEQD